MANKQPGDQPYNIILAGKCGVGKRALFERIKERHTVVEEGPTAKHFDMIQHAAACNGSEVMVSHTANCLVLCIRWYVISHAIVCTSTGQAVGNW